MRPNGIVRCWQCGKSVPFSLHFEADALVLTGAALPFDPNLQCELKRRKAGALCIPCWRGDPVQEPKEPPVVLFDGAGEPIQGGIA